MVVCERTLFVLYNSACCWHHGNKTLTLLLLYNLSWYTQQQHRLLSSRLLAALSVPLATVHGVQDSCRARMSNFYLLHTYNYTLAVCRQVSEDEHKLLLQRYERTLCMLQTACEDRDKAHKLFLEHQRVSKAVIVKVDKVGEA